MKKIKAAISMIMVVSLLFVLGTTAFANNSPYEELKTKGLPSDYLNSLSEEMLVKLQKSIGDNDVKSITNKTVYLNENNATESQIQTFGSISSNSMALSITAFEIYDRSTNIVSLVCVGVNWQWVDGKPSIRLNDAVAVNWDSSLFYLESNGFCSQDKWSLSGMNHWTISKEYDRPAESNQGGIGYYTKLTNDPNFRTDVGGDTLILLTPTYQIYSGSSYGTSINVNYVHNRSILIPTSLSFSKTSFGVSINSILLSDAASSTVNYRYSK